MTVKSTNKRIAAALFLWFLDWHGALHGKDCRPQLSDTALVAITLMISASRPTEKEVLTRIVMHLLCEGISP